MKDIAREQVIAEVLELGEMLFDTVIDAVEHRPLADKANDASLIEEMRAAASEFFTAVRLLLEIGQVSHPRFSVVSETISDTTSQN